MSRYRLLLATALAALLLVGGFSLRRWQQERANAQLLVRLARGGQQTTYQAVAETELPGEGGTQRVRACVYHLAHGPTRLEQAGATGPGACVVMGGRESWHYDPEQGRLADQPSPSLTAEKLLVANYRLRRRGELVGGARRADIFELYNRRTGQLRKRLWVDETTGITLRQETFNRGGRLVSRMRLLEISFPKNLTPSRFQRPTAEKRVVASRSVSVELIEKRLGFPLRRPRYLPPGYALLGTFIFSCPCGCEARSAQLLYGDGLDSFSLFETAPDKGGCNIAWACHEKQAPGQPVLTELGPARALGAMQGPVALLAIGDLDPDTLARVVSSAR